MILADKIIQLRKKQGWSQEALAEQLNVSRQTISKWEGAQSVPDLNRILQIAELFGVSTDYLLKDELEEPNPAEGPEETQDESPLRSVTMEQADQYLAYRDHAAGAIGLGVMLCILCSVPLILLTGIQEAGRGILNEAQAGGIGAVILFLIIGAAVALFVVQGMKGHVFQWIEQEDLDTAYGVDSMVRSRREAYRPRYVQLLVVGIVLCVLSVVPVIAAGTVVDSWEEQTIAPMMVGRAAEGEIIMIVAVAALLLMVAVGVLCIVRCSVVWSGFNVLLERGDYSRTRKQSNKKNEALSRIYWSFVTALYLGISFITWNWGSTWIIWPVAAVGYGVISGVAGVIRSKVS